MTTDMSDNRRTNQARRATPARRERGFTLIELLVVIIIIAILAAITITIQRTAVESAMRARTNATIRKIDTALTAAYEKYQYRKFDVAEIIAQRVAKITFNISVEQKRVIAAQEILNLVGFDYSDLGTEERYNMACHILRTLMLRELLVLDFPTNYNEVVTNPLFLTDVSTLNQNYRTILTQNGLTSETLSDADLLYLIVTNIDPQTRGVFLERETVDTNKNGIPEFVDGWGNPIRFFRWAPALADSDRQPPAVEVGRYLWIKNEIAAGNTLTADDQLFYDDFRENLADPIDPLCLTNGWLLVPLVFSAGADKEYGTALSQTFLATQLGRNTSGLCYFPFDMPFFVVHSDGTASGLGADDGSGFSADNLTNHNMNAD